MIRITGPPTGSPTATPSPLRGVAGVFSAHPTTVDLSKPGENTAGIIPATRAPVITTGNVEICTGSIQDTKVHND